MIKMINPIGWRHKFHPQKPYFDCASTISIVLELLDNYSRWYHYCYHRYYRTVHEIFTSYGSSFNSFEVIGSFSSFENLFPYSTPFRRVTRTNSVTFSFIWNLGSSTSFLFTYFFIIFPSLFFFYFFFYSLPSFLKSHRFDPVESDPFSHWAKGTK